MNKTFLIADTHFFHNAILKYENRPFNSVEDMNARLIQNWNAIVSKDDKVFHLGDVSFGSKEATKAVISQLNGRKILILGNHDRGRTVQWWLDVGFNEVSKYPIIYKEFIVMQHEPPTYYNDASPYFYCFGHVHSTEMYKTVTPHSCCVCVERWNYAPVDLDHIQDLVKLL